MFIRLPRVKAKTALARSTIYAGVKAGTFPPPVSLGSKAVGWIESEIDAWIEARIKASRGANATLPTAHPVETAHPGETAQPVGSENPAVEGAA